MDDKEQDADGCYDKLVYLYWSLLERNNMMSLHTKPPKAAVKALVEGLSPSALKAFIKKNLDLDQKHLRNSVHKFMTYVKVKLVAQLEFTRATKVTGIIKTSGDESSRAGSVSPRNVKALMNTASSGTPGCQDIKKAPNAEKKAIQDKWKAKWTEKKERKPTKSKVVKSLRWTGEQPADGCCWSEIPRVALEKPISTLIDSGSNPGMLLSNGLFGLIALHSKVDLQAKDLPTPQVKESFGGGL
ncbi:hypothetical protein H310_15332 [Aphanomyces invadans]|uniref:Uncharacterized protein n=1 Tax=Aphanomyces invadans TaxID=157072 RepID=A0A024T7L9_9STRA|nr:hypothetical protein H310_15332 [Aphanomyces invadans]ETV89829.1 hypothetical protein H310_15332 [Aphanomyces invadans]|eukprot:XP_008881539.1 hypothetical protein H310_15332 [Aphanomyces invadans]